MSFIRIVYSELIKTKGTYIIPISLISSVLYPIFMIWYFYQHNLSSLEQIKIYSGFFEVISVALSIIIALFTGIMASHEEEAGNFRGMLLQTTSRKKLYIGKLIMFILITSIAIFLATTLMLFGMKSILHIEYIQYGLFLQGSCWTIVGSLTIFSIHLFISFAYGLGTSVSVGGLGFLISSIIGATTMGDDIWQFIPWAWSIRLSKNPVVLMLDIKLIDGILTTEFFFQELLKGVLPSIISFVLITVFSLVWFDRWEGRRFYYNN